MSAIHEIQWSVSSAVLALHIPEPHVPTPERRPVPALRTLSYLMMPFGMVTAAALLVMEVHTERQLPPAVFEMIRYSGSISLQPNRCSSTRRRMQHCRWKAPPTLHAAAPEETDVSRTHTRNPAEPSWSLSPPPDPPRLQCTAPHRFRRMINAECF